ncbi:MAG: hypothetical protein PUP91_39340 [Rhizonema sp. PD37]|nr:hypothetical protein [Rhizonema sp. PD37]
MQREVKDANEITWTCIQAYAGLSNGEENKAAALVSEERDTYWVVCTPSGGAKSVRLELNNNWEESLNDKELLHKIQQQLEQ